MQKKSTIKPSAKEFDQQKKQKIVNQQSVLSYRKIALSFLGLTLILSLGILHLATARVKIIITPNPEKIKTSFKIKICSLESDEIEQKNNCIHGQISAVTVEEKEKFSATQVRLEEKKASGEVIIINKYSRSQTLIKNTRLLSAEGILFRTDYTIQIPAGSKTQVGVHADQSGAQGEIGPSRFTIPGLWPGIQDKIYGESEKAMVGGLEEIKIVTEDDIKKAKAEMEKKLTDKAPPFRWDSKKTGLKEAFLKVGATEIIETIIDANAGDQKDEFEIKMKLKLVALFFDEEEMLTLVQEKLTNLVPQNMKLLSPKKQDVTYVLDNYNLETQTASLEISAQGQAIITSCSPLLIKDHLIGKNEKELKVYLEKFPEISSVQVNFSPFWLRKVPVLRDHIEIQVVF